MFGFIAFGFKLLLAAIIGGALSYVPGDSEGEYKIVETSLICILSAAILGLASQFPVYENNFAMGFAILAVSLILLSISKNFDFANRMMWLFAGATGMIVGAGYIFQAVFLGVLVYIILQNSDKLFNYFDKESSKSTDAEVENISN